MSNIREIYSLETAQNNIMESRVLMSTAYLPPIDYMAVLTGAQEVVMEIHETYPKQSWRNRCRIAGVMGAMDLSVPVSKVKGVSTKTGQVIACQRENWALKHWRAIQSAYGKAPFFPYYQDVLAALREYSVQAGSPERDAGECFEGDEGWECGNTLLSLNMRLLQAMLNALDMNPSISLSPAFEKQPNELVDLRNAFSPKSRQQKVIIPSWPSYTQVFSDRHGFIPGLSIIDLLFHVGPDTPAYLRELSAKIRL